MMKKTIALLLACVLALSCAGALLAAAETYEDSLYLRENGEFACDVPYGYVWEVDYIDGVIIGEDVTICTTVDAYNKCNPKWAITNILQKQANGTYVAVRDSIVGSGSIPVIDLLEDQIAFVVHSAGSVPENCLGSYENWVGKVVAVSVKKGDIFEIDLQSDPMTVYAVVPGEIEPEEIWGDADGDGKIDSADVTRLLRYLANYDYTEGACEIELSEGADCNGDGMIDGRDSVRLLQYLANRDPQTGESTVRLGPTA